MKNSLLKSQYDRFWEKVQLSSFEIELHISFVSAMLT